MALSGIWPLSIPRGVAQTIFGISKPKQKKRYVNLKPTKALRV